MKAPLGTAGRRHHHHHRTRRRQQATADLQQQSARLWPRREHNTPSRSASRPGRAPRRRPPECLAAGNAPSSRKGRRPARQQAAATPRAIDPAATPSAANRDGREPHACLSAAADPPTSGPTREHPRQPDLASGAQPPSSPIYLPDTPSFSVTEPAQAPSTPSPRSPVSAPQEFSSAETSDPPALDTLCRHSGPGLATCPCELGGHSCGW